MDGSPLISLQGVAKTYGKGAAEFKALGEVELSIFRGEYIAVTGPSGSGKSTLMNILGCLDTPTAGRYLYDSQNVTELSADERSLLRLQSLGFVFQGFNLLSRTSALENVELPLIYQRVSAGERRDRARAALEAVGLGSKLNNRPNELSGGQQQRVAIARAIVNSPQTMLADEPTGNLDTRTAGEIMELLERLNAERNITLIVVTHELSLAHRARRRIEVRDGRVEHDLRN